MMKPIETAPKDGSVIWLYARDKDGELLSCKGFWGKAMWLNRGGWIDYNHAPFPLREFTPTHWSRKSFNPRSNDV